MTRAMTLLETLLALALLGGISIASVSWLQIAGRNTQTIAEESRWLTAADAALDVINESLTTTDTNVPTHRELTDYLAGNLLVIPTRTDGRAARRLIGVEDNRLLLDDTPGRSVRISTTAARLLVGDVATFSCEIEEDSRLLTVTLESTTGLTRQRSAILP